MNKNVVRDDFQSTRKQKLTIVRRTPVGGKTTLTLEVESKVFVNPLGPFKEQL